MTATYDLYLSQELTTLDEDGLVDTVDPLIGFTLSTHDTEVESDRLMWVLAALAENLTVDRLREIALDEGIPLASIDNTEEGES